MHPINSISGKAKNISIILDIPNLLCCWDFDGNDPYTSKGKQAYRLLEGNGSLAQINEGVIGGNSIDIKEGRYLFIPRDACTALNIYGKHAQVTVLAWIKRQPKSYSQCEAIAGMWNETQRKRQYCLFINLQLFNSADQVCGHISGVGGPTPGQRWCIDASIGKRPVLINEWNFIGFTYDGTTIKSYLNGELDSREERNPYPYSEGIFSAGDDGSDFTIGAVDRLGEMGNYFVGQMSGLAVFDRALHEKEIEMIHAAFPCNH